MEFNVLLLLFRVQPTTTTPTKAQQYLRCWLTLYTLAGPNMDCVRFFLFFSISQAYISVAHHRPIGTVIFVVVLFYSVSTIFRRRCRCRRWFLSLGKIDFCSNFVADVFLVFVCVCLCRICSLWHSAEWNFRCGSIMHYVDIADADDFPNVS